MKISLWILAVGCAACSESSLDPESAAVLLADNRVFIEAASDDSFVVLAEDIQRPSREVMTMALWVQGSDMEPLRLSARAYWPFICRWNNVFTFGDDPEIDPYGRVLATWKVWRKGWPAPRVLSPNRSLRPEYIVATDVVYLRGPDRSHGPLLMTHVDGCGPDECQPVLVAEDTSFYQPLGDGRQVGYQVEFDERIEFWWADISDGTKQKLGETTAAPAADQALFVLSSDGARVAMANDMDGFHVVERASGAILPWKTTTSRDATAFRFDGPDCLYVRLVGQDGSALYRASPAGLERVAPAFDFRLQPRKSGARYAFIRDSSHPGPYPLTLVELDTGRTWPLAENGSEPSFAHDGDAAVFAESYDLNTSWGIVRKIDLTTLQTVEVGETWLHWARFVPDTTRLLYLAPSRFDGVTVMEWDATSPRIVQPRVVNYAVNATGSLYFTAFIEDRASIGAVYRRARW